MKKLYRILFITFFLTTVIILTGGVIKGQVGNPIYYQTLEERNKTVGGPFESTGSTSRYALIEAIVEDQTFFLNEERARFAAPDMAQYKDKFLSIFTPGVSFFELPFYIAGKMVGLPQLVTFASTTLLAVINVFLVARLSQKLGTSFYVAFIAGLTFLFATNAISYALTLTQHHLSTTIILLALINAFGKTTFIKNIWFGLLFSAGLLVDIPNGIMMVPIGIYMLLKHFKKLEPEFNKIKFNIKLSFVAILLGMIPLLAVFGWYNYETTGSYTTVAQNIGRSDYFEPSEVREKNRIEKANQDEFEKKLPFDTRNQLSELYILLVSDERGWLVYSPVILIGVLGLYYIYHKKEKNFAIVIISVILSNIVIYSLFGGLGGWAFGPRYLIPSAAILATAIGIAIDRFKKQPIFMLVFVILLAYSLGVNALGAMTTTQIPPKVEAVALSKPIPYTYEYNFRFIEQNKSSSLLYNIFFNSYFSFRTYLIGYIAAVLVMVLTLYVLAIREGEK